MVGGHGCDVVTDIVGHGCDVVTDGWWSWLRYSDRCWWSLSDVVTDLVVIVARTD